MAMGSKGEIGVLPRTGEVYTCPGCGYTDGFHIAFKFSGEGGTAEVHLICPSCHSRFRIGWKMEMNNV